MTVIEDCEVAESMMVVVGGLRGISGGIQVVCSLEFLFLQYA